jgi:hypothetical protein
MTPDRIYLSHTHKNSSTGTWHSLVDAVKTSDVAYVREDAVTAELLEWIRRIRDDRENGLRMTQRDQATHLIAKWEKKE